MPTNAKPELIDSVLLEIVNGASSVWDAVDSAVSMIPGNHDWKDQACAARGSWIGTTYGATTGLVGAFALKKLGPYGQWGVGTSAAFAGTKIYSSYINNCEQQKAAAAKK